MLPTKRTHAHAKQHEGRKLHRATITHGRLFAKIPQVSSTQRQGVGADLPQDCKTHCYLRTIPFLNSRPSAYQIFLSFVLSFNPAPSSCGYLCVQDEYPCANATTAIIRPRTVEDVQEAVRTFAKIKGVGEGHSWNQVGWGGQELRGRGFKGADGRHRLQACSGEGRGCGPQLEPFALAWSMAEG